jgi:threonine dehydrogenase-like Zn-dependent dehydrogenase
MDDAVAGLREMTNGEGFNDVFVFAPVPQVIEQGDAILGFDGCLNFFAGPSKTDFSAKMNFYNVHYAYTHIVGTSGGNTDDMKEALDVMTKGLDPAGLVTHIGGLKAVPEATLDLPNIPGGKKLIYTHIDIPLTAIADFKELGKHNEKFNELAILCEKHNGLWNVEAEAYLLANFV